MRRTAFVLAVPPVGMLALLIWQVLLGHVWGKPPISNANVIGWTVFLWLIYFRLLTVRLVTGIRDGKLTVNLRGVFLSRRVPLDSIRSTEVITHNPARDYGGYGFRSTRAGKAYVAGGNRGVRVTLKSGEKLVIGSERPDQLASALRTNG